MHRYAQVSGAIFALVGGLQFVRILRGWPLKVGDLAIPLWASGCALVVAAALALWAYRTRRVPPSQRLLLSATGATLPGPRTTPLSVVDRDPSGPSLRERPPRPAPSGPFAGLSHRTRAGLGRLGDRLPRPRYPARPPSRGQGPPPRARHRQRVSAFRSRGSHPRQVEPPQYRSHPSRRRSRRHAVLRDGLHCR